MKEFLEISGFFILFYFLSINAIYILLLFLGGKEILKRHQEIEEDPPISLHLEKLPFLSFVIAMYNEEEHIVSTIESLLNLSYKNKEILVVNDGSEDQSMQILKDRFALEQIPNSYPERLKTAPIRAFYQSKTNPSLFVIDKDHLGKHDALNAGINACSQSFFIGFDADTMIDDTSFNAFLRPLFNSHNMAALGAGVRVKNGCSHHFNQISTEKFPVKILPAIQSCEYLCSFLSRQGWNHLGGNFVIAGACAIFSKEIAIQVGGFLPSHGEDMEIVVRMQKWIYDQKRKETIRYIPDPIAWSHTPETLKELGKQRTRWHLGLLQTLWKHRSLCFNPRYGLFGMLAFPFALWGEAIEPLIEFFAIVIVLISWYYKILNLSFFALLVLVSLGFSFLYSVTSLFIEEISFKRYPSFRSLVLLTFVSFLQNLGYRQLTIFWRLRAFSRFFKTAIKNLISGQNPHKQDWS